MHIWSLVFKCIICYNFVHLFINFLCVKCIALNKIRCDFYLAWFPYLRDKKKGCALLVLLKFSTSILHVWVLFYTIFFVSSFNFSRLLLCFDLIWLPVVCAQKSNLLEIDWNFVFCCWIFWFQAFYSKCYANAFVEFYINFFFFLRKMNKISENHQISNDRNKSNIFEFVRKASEFYIILVFLYIFANFVLNFLLLVNFSSWINPWYTFGIWSRGIVKK